MAEPLLEPQLNPKPMTTLGVAHRLTRRAPTRAPSAASAALQSPWLRSSRPLAAPHNPAPPESAKKLHRFNLPLSFDPLLIEGLGITLGDNCHILLDRIPADAYQLALGIDQLEVDHVLSPN